jgi:hypothetical protein
VLILALCRHGSPLTHPPHSVPLGALYKEEIWGLLGTQETLLSETEILTS